MVDLLGRVGVRRIERVRRENEQTRRHRLADHEPRRTKQFCVRIPSQKLRIGIRSILSPRQFGRRRAKRTEQFVANHIVAIAKTSDGRINAPRKSIGKRHDGIKGFDKLGQRFIRAQIIGN